MAANVSAFYRGQSWGEFCRSQPSSGGTRTRTSDDPSAIIAISFERKEGQEPGESEKFIRKLFKIPDKKKIISVAVITN